MRYAIALATALILSGCGIVPTYSRIPIAEDVAARTVFDCAEKTTSALRAESDFWPTEVRSRNDAAGVFEMGEYGAWNVLGYRYRLELRKGSAALSVRATSLYFKDLGAKDASARLGRGIQECISTARLERTRA